jgi:hypothetical protein
MHDRTFIPRVALHKNTGCASRARQQPDCQGREVRWITAHVAAAVLNNLFGLVRWRARRTASSVALAIFWRRRGEVQRARTIAPGHEGMGAVCGTALLLMRAQDMLNHVMAVPELMDTT